MSRRGNLYDNAKAESSMKTLKVEAIEVAMIGKHSAAPSARDFGHDPQALKVDKRGVDGWRGQPVFRCQRLGGGVGRMLQDVVKLERQAGV